MYETRIAKGVEWLDSEHPNWRDEITEPLDMHDVEKCVIGQVLGDFNRLRESWDWSADHGFYLSDSEVQAARLADDDWSTTLVKAYHVLTGEWNDYLTGTI